MNIKLSCVVYLCIVVFKTNAMLWLTINTQNQMWRTLLNESKVHRKVQVTKNVFWDLQVWCISLIVLTVSNILRIQCLNGCQLCDLCKIWQYHWAHTYSIFMLWVCSCCTVSTNEHQMCSECVMAIIVLKKIIKKLNTVQKRNDLNTTTH